MNAANVKSMQSGQEVQKKNEKENQEKLTLASHTFIKNAQDIKDTKVE